MCVCIEILEEEKQNKKETSGQSLFVCIILAEWIKWTRQWRIESTVHAEYKSRTDVNISNGI